MTDPALIEETILRLLAESGPDGIVSPTEVARRIAGDSGDKWGPVMQPLRRVAIRLAKEGRLVIYRKGKPVDPDDFKGIYKLGAARQD